ncbi:uncharacterized protein LOC123196529 [Mangifera indica]|uniref:uncharacterized protein LOC123196529 n=1 Tax=Mangifera indica TaxID=29780 RepID=UPI001CF9CD58|nr:uncharacterized protein LOC123196529 [Mangifera indica]
MAEHHVLPVSDHRSPTKVYPLANGDTSQLYPSRPRVHYGMKRWAKLTALPILIIAATISLTALVCILMYFTLGPKLPVLFINSASASNLSTANTSLRANWDINLTFKNSDRLWEISLDFVDCIVFYQDEDFSLAVNHSVLGPDAKPVKVKKMKETTMNVKLSTGDHFSSSNNVLNKINDDIRSGKVVFNLSVRARTRFEGVSWLWWTEGGTIIYVCMDLNVGFKDEKGVGFLTGETPVRC